MRRSISAFLLLGSAFASHAGAAILKNPPRVAGAQHYCDIPQSAPGQRPFCCRTQPKPPGSPCECLSPDGRHLAGRVVIVVPKLPATSSHASAPSPPPGR